MTPDSSFEKIYLQTIRLQIIHTHIDWLVWFYGISIFVGYLTPNAFYVKKNQFCMSTQFNSQKYFYFKLFSLFKQS